MPRKHHLAPQDLDFPDTLHADKHKLEKADVPVVTISATFKQDIETLTHEKAKIKDEVVLSRAHYSMAVAILEKAKEMKKTAWLVDPINYVSPAAWKGIARVEYIGQMTARIALLRTLKNIFDKFIRSKLPIAKAIEGPLLYAVRLVTKPVVSIHYEAGNILSRNNKVVLQVVTDPHVRPHYLFEADRPNITFAVFDEGTKKEFFRKAEEMGKKVDQERVVVTGPPVDPRIIKARLSKKKSSFKERGLRLVITTSGLGTNKHEIEKILDNIFASINNSNLELLVYCSTHADFNTMLYSLAYKYKVPVGSKTDKTKVRVLFNSSIVHANQDLIDFGFPWADGFVTKPSGDMAYDAVAAGCFLLTLEPWGEWEEAIEKIFTDLGIAKKAEIGKFSNQLQDLINSGWIEEAQDKALNIDKLYLEGAEKIIKLHQKLAKLN